MTGAFNFAAVSKVALIEDDPITLTAGRANFFFFLQVQKFLELDFL